LIGEIMKNIELIDKAINQLIDWPSSESEEAHLYQFDSGRFVAGISGGSTPAPFCTRAEFEARKAERQNKPDWKDAPDWAQWLAQDGGGRWYWYDGKPKAIGEEFGMPESGGKALYQFKYGEVIGDWRDTLEQRPYHIGEANEKAVTESDWPDEKRIDVIGPNGNDGLHYAEKDTAFKFCYGVFNLVDDSPKTAADYLAACAKVQLERGKQYDASGTGERSFDAAAEAFNCVTGKSLRGSDVCLMLVMVKLVRQYSDHARLHSDSVLDMVSYASLLAEELTKELGK
jgi:hypothetical protein